MKHLPKLLISSLITLSALPSLTMGADLLSLYKKAENYDAGIFAAKSAYLAEREGENIAQGRLLPSINAQASKNYTDDSNNAAVANSTQQAPDDSYKVRTYAVSLSQPLINFSIWHDLSASEQNSLREEALYFAAQQNLILDVSNAYFGVLRAQEDLKSTKSQEAAVKRQYEQAKEQFDVGLIAITDVHEANASYDSSKTLRIQNEGKLTLARENLSRITGEYATQLETLKADFPVTIDKYTSVEQWVESAYQNNLNIKAAEFALNTTKESFKASRSEHYPTLNLEAGYSDTAVTNSAFNNRDTDSSNIKFTLNVPLYSGGSTQAKVRQQRHLVEQARQQLISERRQAQIEIRTEYISITTNIQTVESLQQNIVSRQSALEATREGYNVGTRNIVEVLDAERNYFTALRDYANARFDFVESNLRIKRAAGTLSVADIEALNDWLIVE